MDTAIITTRYNSDLLPSGSIDLNVFPGKYKIKELVTPGFTINTLNPILIDINSGETGMVSFINEKIETLTINKIAHGSDDTFNFIISTTGGFNILSTITTINGTGSTQVNLYPDTYYIEELPKLGWKVDNDNPIIVTLTTGNTGTATFTNNAVGTLRIEKNTINYPRNATFQFNITSLNNIDLKEEISIITNNGTGSIDIELNIGTYQIEEIYQDGWIITSDNPIITEISAGNTTTISFNNQQPTTLIIEKFTTGGDGTFPYKVYYNDSLTYTPNVTTTSGYGSVTISNAIPGEYSFIEDVTTGWTATTSTNLNAYAYSNETLRVTFHNKLLHVLSANLEIQKFTTGGDGTFTYEIFYNGNTIGTFTITTTSEYGSVTISNVTPGEYSFIEYVPDEWEATSPTGLTGYVSDGQTLVAQFHNKILPSTLILVKEAIGGDDKFSFIITGTNGDEITVEMLTINGTRSQTISGLLPQTYTIKENSIEGWNILTSNPQIIELVGGQSSSVKFTNERSL